MKRCFWLGFGHLFQAGWRIVEIDCFDMMTFSEIFLLILDSLVMLKTHYVNPSKFRLELYFRQYHSFVGEKFLTYLKFPQNFTQIQNLEQS